MLPMTMQQPWLMRPRRQSRLLLTRLRRRRRRERRRQRQQLPPALLTLLLRRLRQQMRRQRLQPWLLQTSTLFVQQVNVQLSRPRPLLVLVTTAVTAFRVLVLRSP